MELVCWNLANALTAIGNKVILIAPQGSKVPKGGFLLETPPPEEKVHVDWIKAEMQMFEYYRKKIDFGDVDIVHGMDWFGSEYLLKKEFPNVKILHTHHGGFSWRSPPPVPKPNLIAVSKHMQAYTKAYFRQLGFDVDCKYVYNGINLDDYPFKKEKGDRLLFVGRFDTFKRPEVAIEVANRLNMGLDLVGGSFVQDPAYITRIKSFVDGERIKMHLDAPHEKKVELYQNALCTLFVSKMGEPFGLISPESLATGTPVIGSRDGAIPEVVTPEVGFICDTIEEMVEAVKKVDTIDPYACRRRVEQFFTKEVMAKNYLKLYEDIVERNIEW